MNSITVNVDLNYDW